jgi:hypothetical protein
MRFFLTRARSRPSLSGVVVCTAGGTVQRSMGGLLESPARGSLAGRQYWLIYQQRYVTTLTLPGNTQSVTGALLTRIQF